MLNLLKFASLILTVFTLSSLARSAETSPPGGWLPVASNTNHILSGEHVRYLDGKTVNLWSADGKRQKRIHIPLDHTNSDLTPPCGPNSVTGTTNSPHRFAGETLSPDGTKILVQTDMNQLSLISAETGGVLWSYKVPQVFFRGAVFTPNGDAIVAVAEDSGQGTILETSTGNVLRVFSYGGDYPYYYDATAVVVSPDGSMIAVAFQEEMIVHVFDFLTGTLVKRLVARDAEDLRGLAFNHDGTLIVASSGRDYWQGSPPSLSIWDVQSEILLLETPIITEPTRERFDAVSFNSDGTSIVVGGDRGTVKLYNFNSQLEEKWSIATTNTVWGVYFSNANTILMRNEAGDIAEIDAASGAIRQTLTEQRKSIREQGMHWSSNSDKLITMTEDSVSLWDLTSSKNISYSMCGHTSFAVSPDFSELYAGSNYISHYSLVSGKQIRNFIIDEPNTAYISRGIAVNFETQILYAATKGYYYEDQSLVGVDLASGTIFEKPLPDRSYGYDAYFSFGKKTGALYFTANRQSFSRYSLLRRDLDTEINQDVAVGQVLQSTNGFPVYKLDSDESLALIESGNQIKIIEVDSGAIKLSLKPYGSDAAVVATFGHIGDLKVVATAQYSEYYSAQNIQIYSIDTGEKIAELDSPMYVTGLSFATDGASLAVATKDSTLTAYERLERLFIWRWQDNQITDLVKGHL